MNKLSVSIRMVFFIFMVQPLFSQTPDFAKLDRYFDVLDSADRFMGSVAVIKNGKMIYQRSVGFSYIEKGLRAKALTGYRIGSISKTFTAVLVMKSVEKGKLTLEQTIDNWFPQVPNANRITLRHLLTHRSGIHNFTDVPTYVRWNTAYKSEQQMLDTIAAQTSDFAPGTKASYSNSGYVLLTLILQKAWGSTYEALLQKYILRPGKLKETTYGVKIDTMGIHAQSYRRVFGWWRQSITDASVPLGAGAISATPVDLARFGSQLFEGKFIAKESVAEMQKLDDNFGMGLFRFPFYERWSYGHGGSIDGFQSVLSCFPKEKLTYALLSNGSAIPTNDVSIAILSAIFGKPFEIPKFIAVELSSKELELYAGTYVSKKVPVKISVYQKDSKMYAQATGQMPFPLIAHGDHRFSYEKAGIEMEFSPQKNEMVMKQGGGSFLFSRE